MKINPMVLCGRLIRSEDFYLRSEICDLRFRALRGLVGGRRI